jgi:extracellular elastinolytic metalloproteinase
MVRRTGWVPRPGRTLAAFVAVATATALVTAVPASADPSAKAPAGTPHDSGERAPRDADNRHGNAAPTARQQAAANRLGQVRWNAFGAPASVGPAADPAATPVAAPNLSADPVAAARQHLTANQDLYGLDAAAVAGLDALLVRRIGAGTVVLLRQRFGDLPAGHDGLVSILLNGDSVVRVTSSLSRDTTAPAPATLTASNAVAAALADAGLSADQVNPAEVRQVAVPTPENGPRAAYEVSLFARNPEDATAFTSYVDARTGEVLVREDLVDFDSDNPTWAVFPAAPPATIPAGGDPRVIWCLSQKPGCALTVRDAASGQAWDQNLATGTPTLTSSGNSANNVVNWGQVPAFPATTSPDRNYTYPFTDQWQQARCNPEVFTSALRNDADAAVANLFAMHNRMHDWSYHLGFTESAWNMQVVNIAPGGLGNDPELGRAQSGALTGSRNNANQGTGRDGQNSQTNMFLWQPVAGTAYPPCVDGDYDMSVIGHEYTHAITNRMIAGPDSGIGGFQGGSMGEAWSDLVAIEYLYENDLRAPGETPFVIGGYVTGNNDNGIRNYDASRSPLNYSDVGFDLVGPEVHADGEIWVTANLRVREAFVKRYGLGTRQLQQRCADGLVDAVSCPGNRRWVQLMFDSYLLQAASQVTMVDMRDNMLAADMVRFGGANQDIIWKAFAESGLGEGATAAPNDTDPTPSFASPYADNATVTLRPLAGSSDAVVRLYVGEYEARVTPVADTDPATALPDTFQILPGTRFQFTVTGAGWGSQKFIASFTAGRAQDLKLKLPRNLASSALGAAASGNGVNLDKLLDETEATDWASLDGVAGRQVTVDLAGEKPELVKQVNVSALLRPAITGDVDAGPQNRFTALRSFAILACNAEKADCGADASYREVYRSPGDAFPGGAFRPFASQLNLRTFTIHPTLATHLRIQVLASQCTGNPQYAGEQDDDPRAATDCATASPFASQVRIAELQVFNPVSEINP